MNALTQFAAEASQPVTLVSAEIDLQIATAKRFPRSIEAFRKSAIAMATLDERVAAQCLYAVPRDGKAVEGASARLAEILVSTWGNCRAASRIVSQDREFVTAQGVFLDLESNAATTKEVQRRIVKSNGQRYSLDVIQSTGNAACSIALRNAVLGGIPRAVWWDVYGAACLVVRGDLRTLANRREAAIEAFKPFGIVEAQIFQSIGVTGRNDIGPDELVKLAGWLNAIKDGEIDPEEVFKPAPRATPVAAPAAKLDALAQNGDAAQQPGTGSSHAPNASSLEAAPPAFDRAVAEARVKAVVESLKSARSVRAVNQTQRNEIAFLAKLDEHWPQGKEQIVSALQKAKEALESEQSLEGTRAGPGLGAQGADGSARGNGG